MNHTGSVVEIQDEYALVRFTRTKACENCKMCGMVGDLHAEISIKNTIGAKIGDRVYVSMENSRVVQAGMLAYVIPLIMLILGVVIGTGINDIWGAIMGILFTGIGLFAVKMLEPVIKRSGKFEPRMISKEENENGGI